MNEEAGLLAERVFTKPPALCGSDHGSGLVGERDAHFGVVGF
ncbi:hypothetical protein [Microbacterium suwonense]|nr:hypothetical protein [Microbacterium suwonense]